MTQYTKWLHSFVRCYTYWSFQWDARHVYIWQFLSASFDAFSCCPIDFCKYCNLYLKQLQISIFGLSSIQFSYVMQAIWTDFCLKNGGIDNSPATLVQIFGNGIMKLMKVFWALGSQNYIKEAIPICETQLDKLNLSNPTGKRARDTSFISSEYKPELDPFPYYAY